MCRYRSDKTWESFCCFYFVFIRMNQSSFIFFLLKIKYEVYLLNIGECDDSNGWEGPFCQQWKMGGKWKDWSIQLSFVWISSNPNFGISNPSDFSRNWGPKFLINFMGVPLELHVNILMIWSCWFALVLFLCIAHSFAFPWVLFDLLCLVIT